MSRRLNVDVHSRRNVDIHSRRNVDVDSMGGGWRGGRLSTATIDDLLTEARTQLSRIEPRAAYASQLEGAILIDIRPEINRITEGRIPGALIIDRNVLEWRLDPSCSDRISCASYDAWIVLFCNEGYASSFAAASLQRLGIHRATDLVGGYRAWRTMGLPISVG